MYDSIRRLPLAVERYSGVGLFNTLQILCERESGKGGLRAKKFPPKPGVCDRTVSFFRVLPLNIESRMCFGGCFGIFQISMLKQTYEITF